MPLPQGREGAPAGSRGAAQSALGADMTLELAFESTGSGPPLVILHGLFGSGRNWRGIARELAATHSVLTVDLRNHGASPWAETMGYFEMADDVQRLFEREGLRQPAVMGHSMGGKVAMALALLHPECVGRLIVVDIAPVPYADRLSPFAEAMRGIDMLAAAGRSEVQQRLAETVPDSGVVPFLMQNLVMRNSHLDWRINLAVISASIGALSDFPLELRSLRFGGPLHVIGGGRSDYVAHRDGTDNRPMFARPQVEVIDEAGHWVHADAPLRFLALVRRALSVKAGTDNPAADAT
jgi:esterase